MVSRLRRSYRLVLIVLLFAAGLVAACLVFPLAERTWPAKSRGMRERISVLWYRALCVSLGLRIEIAGELCADAEVWVSNHISWLDIVALGQVGPVSFVAKSEVERWPVLGVLARRGGTLFIRRGDRRSGREVGERMAWCVRQGARVCFFPEGTTGDGRTLLRFHSALFQPAAMTSAIIQPVALRYNGASRRLAPFIGDDEFVPHLVRLLGLKHIEVAVQFCAPLKSAGMDRTALADLTYQRIHSALSWGEGCDWVVGTAHNH